MKDAYHDKFVRSAMSFPDVCIPFLKTFLAPKLLQAIEIESVELSKESYVDVDLKGRISDLVFRIPYQDYNALFYVLVEHKSSGADRGNRPRLPWQMALLERDLMESLRRMHEHKRLPLVHCLGVYHGVKPYNGPTTVAQLMDAPDELIPDHWKEPVAIIDLGDKKDDELIALGGKLSVFLLVLKHVYDDKPVVALRQLKQRLGELETSPDGLAFVTSVIAYLLKTSGKENQDDMKAFVVESLSASGGATVITIADALREEGIKIGEARAEKAMAEALAKLEAKLKEQDEAQIRLKAEREEEQIRLKAEREEAQARREAEREEAQARREAERVTFRLSGLREAILGLRASGMSFEQCVDMMKLSQDTVCLVIQNYPELAK